MSYCSYRWVKNAFAFPLPNARGKRQWKHSRQTIMIWAPPHHSTLRFCLFSHQPSAQAPYEMSASWLIPVFYSEWIVINASFPYFAELASLGKKPPLLYKKRATGCLPVHTQPKSMSPCWHTHLTKGLCWMSVSRVFGLAWVKKKHLDSNYRSIVAINKAVTFTSPSSKPINYQWEEGGAGRGEKGGYCLLTVAFSHTHSKLPRKPDTSTIQRHITPQNPSSRSVLLTPQRPIGCFDGSFT